MTKKFGSVLKNQRNILGPLNPKKGSQNGENVIISYKLLNLFISNWCGIQPHSCMHNAWCVWPQLSYN